MRHTRAHPEPAKANHETPKASQSQPEDNNETYQSITIAHHETYQSQPEDTKQDTQSLPRQGIRHHNKLKQGMRHTRVYQMSL